MFWILVYYFQDRGVVLLFFKCQIVDAQAPKPCTYPSRSFFTRSLLFALSAPRSIWCWFGGFFSASFPLLHTVIATPVEVDGGGHLYI